MATYRLKSKIFGELDNLSSKKDEKKGFLGTGLSTGQVLLGTAAAVGGYKMAGAGKFGVGAQNAVNKFRVRTSAAGSARQAKGLAGLDANYKMEQQKWIDFAKNTGMNATDTAAGLRNLRNEYGGMKYGSSRMDQIKAQIQTK